MEDAKREGQSGQDKNLKSIRLHRYEPIGPDTALRRDAPLCIARVQPMVLGNGPSRLLPRESRFHFVKVRYTRTSWVFFSLPVLGSLYIKN